MLVLSYSSLNILKTQFSCGISHIVCNVKKGCFWFDDDTRWKVGRLYVFALGFPAAANVVAVAVEVLLLTSVRGITRSTSTQHKFDTC